MEATKRQSLFQIGEDLAALEDLLLQLDGDISDPAIGDTVTKWFAELEQNLGGKVDNYIAIIRKWESEAVAAKAEAEQYLKAAQVRANRIERMKSYMMDWLTKHNRKSVETPTGRSVTIQKNGGKQPVDIQSDVLDRLLMRVDVVEQKYHVDPIALPDIGIHSNEWTALQHYLRVRTFFDTNAMRADLEAGKSVPFVELKERGQHLRIK